MRVPLSDRKICHDWPAATSSILNRTRRRPPSSRRTRSTQSPGPPEQSPRRRTSSSAPACEEVANASVNTNARARIAFRDVDPSGGRCASAHNGTSVPGPVSRSVAQGARPLGPQGRLRAVGHPDALEEVREVTLHGLLADAPAARDLLVREALEDQGEHLALTSGERHLGWTLPAVGEQGGGRPGRDRRLAP